MMQPMGIVSWLAAALVAFGFARVVRRFRRRAASELAGAAVASILAGLLATALDFGGWSVFDPRSATLAALGALAAIAIVRLVPALRR
jgi:hypothetical protein